MKKNRNQIQIFAFVIAISISIALIPSTAMAKKTIRKVQEVNFSEMNLKGTIRNPDGAYLVQRKGLKFIPLHNLQKNMDQKIREADLYLR